MKVIPNYRTLGKKVGKLMNQVKARIESLDSKALGRLQKEGKLAVCVEGEEILLTEEDIQVKREVLEGQIALTLEELTVTLDTALSEELISEGFAREIVNKINTMRKGEGFEITDRIHITMQATGKVREAFESHKDYICHEVLAKSVVFGECSGTEVDLNGEMAVVALQKVVN